MVDGRWKSRVNTILCRRECIYTCVCVCVCELLLLVQCIQHQLIHLSLSLSLSPLPSLLLPHNTRHTSIYILSCADYCKHLMKTTKEKEDAVEKARNELEMKKRKLEEEKANESRSDPESVTSSLTGSMTTTMAARMPVSPTANESVVLTMRPRMFFRTIVE